MTRSKTSPISRIVIVGAMLALSACASSKLTEDGTRIDSWEPVNRPIHKFNTGVDNIIFKPVAKGYEFIIPSFMRRGVTNFSRNLRSPLNAINNLLQGKGGEAMNDVGRFIANSTFGIGGLFDVATPTGLPTSEEDFGQTFAVWGVPDGPYVVIPFLGPRNLRDAFLIPLNFLADPLYHYDNSSVRDKLYILRFIDVRQRLFRAEDLIKDSQDRYISIRESYLQRRQYLIYDGDPPEQDDIYGDEEYE